MLEQLKKKLTSGIIGTHTQADILVAYMDTDSGFVLHPHRQRRPLSHRQKRTKLYSFLFKTEIVEIHASVRL